MAYYQYTPSCGGNYSVSKCVKTLLIVNIGVFLLTNLLIHFPWFFIFGLVPGLITTKFMLWQPFTYMFMHAGIWHLAVNMLMLWFFGPALEDAWGAKKFLTYYFFTGLGAGLCSFFTSVGSFIPVIGASGAIFGLLVAYAIMFPDTMILVFFLFPMPIRQAVIFMAAINLLGAISSTGGGIAYFAHLGGGLFGYFYFKSENLRRFLSGEGIEGFKQYFKHKAHMKRSRHKQEDKKEVDMILDKIAKYGIDSLSHREKETLEKRSKNYRA